GGSAHLMAKTGKCRFPWAGSELDRRAKAEGTALIPAVDVHALARGKVLKFLKLRLGAVASLELQLDLAAQQIDALARHDIEPNAGFLIYVGQEADARSVGRAPRRDALAGIIDEQRELRGRIGIFDPELE